MEQFPRLDRSAYLMVIVIGIKLIVDWGTDFDFMDPAGAAFWIFWLSLIICLGTGLIHRKPAPIKADV
jgi:predicted tellurium resistance membrane protein TerC